MMLVFVTLSVVEKVRAGCICKLLFATGIPLSRPAPEEEVEEEAGGIVIAGVGIGGERAQ